jgi:hypothetical protein
MFGWFWRLRKDGKFLVHPNGVGHYADRAAAILVADALGRLQKVQAHLHEVAASAQRTAKLIQQKWNKLRDLAGPQTPGSMPVSREEYEGVRRRVQRHLFIILALVAGEAFLNYLSLVVVIAAEGLVFEAVRIVVALVLTLVAVLVFDYLFRGYLSKEPQPQPEKVLSTVLAAVTLVFIFGITLARARDFEGGESGIGMVGLGFILASLVLPVVGGWMYFERERSVPSYHRMRQWRRAMVALRKLEAELGNQVREAKKQLDGFEAGFDEDVNRWYGGVVEFRVKKGVRNPTSPDDVDVPSIAFAESQSAFRQECQNRFAAGAAPILQRIRADIDSLEALRARSIEPHGDESWTEEAETES